MIKKQTEAEKYIEQIEEFGDMDNIAIQLTGIANLLIEKKVATEDELYGEFNKIMKDEKEAAASE